MNPNLKQLCVIVCTCLCILVTSQASAALLINEFLADPPLDLAGDANRDGIRHFSDDEFVEILNTGSSAADISNWFLADAISIRHQFEPGIVIPPAGRFVIFGGGNLGNFPYVAAIASAGSLSLNNTGDEILLKDALDTTVDHVIYGNEANFDQSLTRFPEGQGVFSQHRLVSQAGLDFSPGTDVDGNLPQDRPQVPEPAALFLAPLLATIAYEKNFAVRVKKFFKD